MQVGSHKVKLSRGSEMSAPAYKKHLETIVERYGHQTFLNLLGSKEGETMLSYEFNKHHRAIAKKVGRLLFHTGFPLEWTDVIIIIVSIVIALWGGSTWFGDGLSDDFALYPVQDIPLINFDYHAQCKGGKQDNLIHLKYNVEKQLSDYRFFYHDGQNAVK